MRNVFWGLVLVTFGVLFLLDNLGVADFGDIIHNFWPLILIFWGVSVLIRRRDTTGGTVEVNVVGEASIANEIQQDLIHQSTVFGDFFSSVTSGNFMGGSVSTVFGDCDLDLSKATFAEGEHILRIHGVFGNTTVVLPKDCAASIQSSTVLGSIVSLGQRRDGFSPSVLSLTTDYINAPRRLKITVSRVFGDVRVS
jgi:predicted membrane protein